MVLSARNMLIVEYLFKKMEVKHLIEREKCPKCGYNGRMQAVNKLGSNKKVYICNKCKNQFEK
jgi:DNA-directed RNA polymerase subunit RPC12/RpoP